MNDSEKGRFPLDAQSIEKADIETLRADFSAIMAEIVDAYGDDQAGAEKVMHETEANCSATTAAL